MNAIKHARRWTFDDIVRVFELRNQGLTYDEIADVIGRTPFSCQSVVTDTICGRQKLSKMVTKTNEYKMYTGEKIAHIEPPQQKLDLAVVKTKPQEDSIVDKLRLEIAQLTAENEKLRKYIVDQVVAGN